MTKDRLEEGANRLGDRFSANSKTSEEEEEESQEEEEIEYHPTTIYLPEETRKELRRFQKRITLDYPALEDAEKREMQTIMIQFALDHPGEIAESVKEYLKKYENG